MSASPGVLLLSPGIVKWDDQDFGLPHLVSLGGYLRAHTGVRVVILDLAYEGGDRAHLERTLREHGPWLLAGVATYSSFDYPRAVALGRFVKGLFPDVPLVTGGYHASARPFDCVGPGLPFDAVIVGEGERPLRAIVEGLLGGGRLEQQIHGPDVVPDLDALPPYAWELLDRYWPHASSLGRKLQIYLSRGCVYHCDFCMERAKSGYSWRAYSPDRAVDELARLARRTPLDRWVVNVADPLFGFHRDWRRQVLEGIVRQKIVPRQFWTLTRSDDLDEVDLQLLADARFSIGIGLESGSPSMLVRMQKGNRPERYLDAVRRLARLADRVGLTWAANVIVGHPGETRAEQEETLAYVRELFVGEHATRGWLSVDPFRLYPGSLISETLDLQEAEHGARFYHPTWWRSWYDPSFKAEHLDASREVAFRDRVRFLFDRYGPLVREIRARFVGQGREVDAVFRNSLDQQARYLAPATRDGLLARADAADRALAAEAAPRPDLAVPIGLHVRDPWVRQREDAVRRLLDRGVLRTEALVEALLRVAPERHLPEEVAREVLAGRTPPVPEGELPWAVSVDLVALGLEALAPGAGQLAVDAAARSGWVSALLAELVGTDGHVIALAPDDPDAVRRTAPGIEVRAVDASAARRIAADRVWIGAALPRRPALPAARTVAFVGPRFRAQDLVLWTEDGERVLARAQVPVLGGPLGWVPARAARAARVNVVVERAEGAAALYRALARMDLGADAANTYAGGEVDRALTDAYRAAPGRLAAQALALLHPERAAVLRALEAPLAALADPAGRALCAVLHARVLAAAPEPDDAARRADVQAWLPARLEPLRARLWAERGAAPPLLVLDAPALGRHGRGAVVDGEHRVAVSLAEGDEHVLMQVLHEEVHPVTDPYVLAEHPGPRDTHRDGPGFAAHRALEQTALAATQLLLESHAPALVPAFVRWTSALGR